MAGMGRIRRLVNRTMLASSIIPLVGQMPLSDNVTVTHRFDLGQTVIAHVVGVPSGPYVIIRKLPSVGNVPQYHVKSESGAVRALLETQITELGPSPSGDS